VRRALLAAARDTYQKHIADCTPQERSRCLELAALYILEKEEEIEILAAGRAF
jgi:acyl-CoA reductase-like NAD-dependent aldehyde dehydrogenase